MRRTILIILCVLSSLQILSQSKDTTDCEKLEDYNQYLWLNAPGEVFVDNGLRCFGLSSIPSGINSFTRIWIVENYFPDSPVIHRLKLFEMGINYRKKYASYYTLEWVGPTEETCKVTCIKRREVEPLHGWSKVENEIKENGLNKINTIPMPTYPDDVATSGSLILLQYVSSDKAINVDFRTYVYIGQSKYKKIRAFAHLLRLIKREFAVNLSLNKKGYDFLNIAPKKSPIYIEQEIPLQRIDSLP